MARVMSIEDAQFEISADDREAAAAALRERGLLDGVDDAENLSLEEAMEELGWILETDDDDNVVDIALGSDAFRTGDDAIFETLAPFVASGSYIEMAEEEEELSWRWDFDGSTCVRDGDEIEEEDDDDEDEDEDDDDDVSGDDDDDDWDSDDEDDGDGADELDFKTGW